jgi:GntR family transcriptional regulator
VIDFRLDSRSGVATYLQLVQQVRQAVLLGRLRAGDRLPTAREVCASLAINPNTVLKAYRDLEREGLVTGRPGVGTFVTGGAARPSAPDYLRRELLAWLDKAAAAGLDVDDVAALVAVTLREANASEKDTVA